MTWIWQSERTLPTFPPNLAAMVVRNTGRFGERALFEDHHEGRWRTLHWVAFQADLVRIQNSLMAQGLGPGQRVAILSPNRLEMLELELAVMALGAIAVPIFPGYTAEQSQELVAFCEPAFVAVANQAQLAKLTSLEGVRGIIHFDAVEACSGAPLLPFSGLLDGPAGTLAGEDVPTDSVCLMMYTSGTMSRPKLVQLTHGNILSQQAAMHTLWSLDQEDRFLSYLPWHHSFGGIYEKYAALYNGALYCQDSGHGKQIETLIENCRRVKPTVFFSVPRVYQQIITRIQQDPSLEKDILHPGLRFVFTAAAPLPKRISDIFEARSIPVYEGWGLTETSPCCTISDPTMPRATGVVGKPIPGVSLKLAEDGEILVRGPNVMKGYYNNPEATEKVLLADGWFATGDIGEFTPTGLRLISRKDRIFKLSNAEKVIPAEIENLMLESCCFLSHVFVAGSGRDHPVGLLFPNKALLADRPDESRLKTGCRCPEGVKDLASCLATCLAEVNGKLDAKYLRPHAVMLVDHQLTVEAGELTPSLKLAPNVVGKVFKAHIEQLYGEDETEDLGDAFIMILEP